MEQDIDAAEATAHVGAAIPLFDTDHVRKPHSKS